MRSLASLLLALAAGPLLAQSPDSAAKPARYADKLYHRPTPVPDRVILTWSGDPATTQSVTWRTATSVQKAVGQIAESEGGPRFDRPADKVRTVTATTQALTADLGEAHYHSVRFEGLSPRTKYVYRVGDGLHWSEWFQFETPSDRPAPLRFIYFGDAQNDLKSQWSRVVRGAYSDMPRADFILHTGDLVNRGYNDAEWGEWHAAGGWINGMVPTVPTPGNHEYSGPAPGLKSDSKSRLTPHWRPQFTLPENGPPGLEETCYYFDIQGVRIISLNSMEQTAEQTPWLEKVLANNPNGWTVVTFHFPVYSTARGRDNKKLRDLWRPIFDKYGVDLVLTGHDHTYGRSGLMREDNLLTGTRAAEKGTVYCVSVSGPKMYKVDDEPWMASRAENLQLYQLITIDGARLHYEARTAKGDLHDEFELRKRPGGVNDLIERDQLEAERAASQARTTPARVQYIIALGAMVGLAGLYGVLRLWRRSPEGV